jgi:monoamine oxidase
MISKDEIFDVIIIGCGPAGIAAAIDFQTIPTLKFILLEARNRVGGRVITDTTTFGINSPVDLGAQWLHHYRPENPLHKYQQLSKDNYINYNFIIRSSTTPFFDIDGKRISSDKIDKAEEIFNQLSNKIKQSSISIDKSMFDIIKSEYNDHVNNNDSQIKRLIDLFFGIIEQYEASNLDQLSAKSYLKSDNGLAECNLAMPNGFGIFLQQIVQQHKLPVELNSIVIRIDTSSLDSIVRIYTEDQRIFLCKYVLVTIPLGCLKAHSIEFIPNLPEWKQNAIDIMGVGLSDKIFLQFPFVFWNPEWASIFCISSRFRFILCRSDTCMLFIKLAARVALEIEEQNEQETIDEIMILLRAIFSDRDVPEPTRYLITKWNQDPFSKGSYSNFAVGADEQTLIDLARECNDRIYWAGEHTNYDGTIGCVDSAFESGQREAKRIVERLKL